ncbi:hypothetical protein [Pedobacter sp. KBS0701]|uniref:hypothetical protein n=1 Tax=unclassified Pedobacter TaxID=2628915 RepID=UPI00110DC1D5|nr:hypothetical protein [Pedobacter sp. KBS0701]QDW25501.1 hypothetical protein FFJ24_012015 [Pedobacter sp. KBS0701]
MNTSLSDHLQSIIGLDYIQKHNLDKNHVFYSIHNKLLGEVSADERMNILFHFEEIKKILSRARRSQMNVANLALKGLEKLNLTYTNQIAGIGMESIHLPMLAYLDYVNENFDLAELHLTRSIELLQVLIDHGIEDCKIASLEQYLNLFKVYMNVGKVDQAVSIVLNLLSYTIGYPSGPINFSSLRTHSRNEQLDVLHFYVNSIFKFLLLKTRKDTLLSTSVKVAVLEKLALDLQCSDLDNDLIPNLKQMILFVINGNYEQEDFTAVVPIETIFSPDVPSFLQFQILQRMIYPENGLLISGETTIDMEILKIYAKNVLELTL